MKKTIYLSVLLSLGLLGSCQKADEPQSLSTTEVQSSEGTFELRLTAEVSEDAMRALTFDGVGDLSETPKIGPTSDFTTHAFFRKKGSNQVGYAKINWQVEGTPGNLKLKLPQTNITLQNMDDQTIDEGEEWYVAGIAGGGVLNPTKDGVSFEPDLNSAPETLRAPIAFPWTRIHKNKMINVTFNPKGVLLRAVVANHVGKRLASIDFDITSNELDYMGQFDFSVASNPLSRIEDNAEALWKFNTGSFGVPQTAKLKFRVKDFEPEAKKHVMVWGMSRQISGGQNLTVVPSTAKTVEVLRAGRVYPFVTKTPMRNTQAYTIEVDLDVLGLEALFATRHINEAGDGFATNDYTEAGFFNWQEAQQLMTSNVPAFAGYHIPSRYELVSLVPAFENENNPRWDESSTIVRARELVQWGSAKFASTGSYKCTNDNVIYGLRFQSGVTNNPDEAMFPSLTNNRRRTAFRYTRQTTGQEPSLIIEMVRLGDDHTVPNIEAIANDGWWNEAKNTRQIAKIVLPLNGYKGSKQASVPFYLGTELRLWSSSLASTSNSNNPLAYRLASNDIGFLVSYAPTSNFFNVRLVKDMDI
ncbi:MAG: hypothetical protein Q4A61_02640 [Porphyromonadaceae bacterium]|nr:hypothetical protein [Porphyromonadaceae bacterium]